MNVNALQQPEGYKKLSVSAQKRRENKKTDHAGDGCAAV
jgi:hypothetical protein